MAWYSSNPPAGQPVVQVDGSVSVTDLLTLQHKTTGTPGTSFGTGILLRGQDASGNDDDMARVATRWSTATAGAEASVFSVGLRVGGAALPAVGSEQLQVSALAVLTLTQGASIHSIGPYSGNASSMSIIPASDAFGIRMGSGAGYLAVYNSGSTTYVDTLAVANMALRVGSNTYLNVAASAITVTDATDIVLGSTAGTKIGTATTQKLGFFNSTPIVKPTVTGSRGANAALASLLTQLAALGLVVDSSS